jgi:hypothetical protein
MEEDEIPLRRSRRLLNRQFEEARARREQTEVHANADAWARLRNNQNDTQAAPPRFYQSNDSPAHAIHTIQEQEEDNGQGQQHSEQEHEEEHEDLVQDDPQLPLSPEPLLLERPNDFSQLQPNEIRHANSQFLGPGHVLIQYGNYECQILRTRHQRSDTFNMDNYQFMLRFHQVNRQSEEEEEGEGQPAVPPNQARMIDTEKVLREALKQALSWIRQEWPQIGQTHLIKINLVERSNDRPDMAFESGAYNMNSESDEQIVNNMLLALASKMTSQREVSLDNNLLLYMKLIRLDHHGNASITDPHDNEPGRAPSGSLGHYNPMPSSPIDPTEMAGATVTAAFPAWNPFPNETNKNLIRLPTGFESLKNRCLPAALIFCHLHQESLRYDYLTRKSKLDVSDECRRNANRYVKVRPITTNSIRKVKGAVKALNKYINEFLDANDICHNGI